MFYPLIAHTVHLKVVGVLSNSVRVSFTLCLTGVEEALRWSSLQRILQAKSITKILYHAQVAMLAIHSAGDGVGAARAWACGEDVAVFDPRVAHYLCDTTVTDEDLELKRICDRCDSHLDGKCCCVI